MPNILDRIPVIDKCCGCITDLKTAVAIIAVLAIVTSPCLSWAIVRHSYVIRVACQITTDSEKPDIVDVSLSNILSFGFGVNAGLGPSCLASGDKKDNSNKTSSNTTPSPSKTVELKEDPGTSEFVNAVRYFGWAVLTADAIFVICSIHFLFMLYRGGSKHAIYAFIMSCLLAITFSFIYGILYVAACVQIGGSFPFFEFLFAFIDVLFWCLWIYFLLVLITYYRKHYPSSTNSTTEGNYWDYLINSYLYYKTTWWEYLTNAFYRMWKSVAIFSNHS